MDLYVEERGQGPRIVLAHGFAGSARNFRPQVRALSDRFRVSVYDAPGHARSEAPPAAPGRYGLDDFVAAFAQVQGSEGGEPCVAGGLSLGAATALHFALRHPGRVKALVLASIPAGAGSHGGGGRSVRASDFAQAIEEEGLDGAGARYVWGPGSGLDAAAGRWVRQGFMEHPGHALAATLRGCLSELPSLEELAPALATLRVPSLVVAGLDDPASLEPSRQLAKCLPEARLLEIPDAGHVVNLAQPAAFNAGVLDFLAELSRE